MQYKWQFVRKWELEETALWVLSPCTEHLSLSWAFLGDKEARNLLWTVTDLWFPELEEVQETPKLLCTRAAYTTSSQKDKLHIKEYWGGLVWYYSPELQQVWNGKSYRGWKLFIQYIYFIEIMYRDYFYSFFIGN